MGLIIQKKDEITLGIKIRVCYNVMSKNAICFTYCKLGFYIDCKNCILTNGEECR